MVERKKEGDFVARPIFSRQVSALYYSIRHPDTGEWVTNTYRVQGSGKQLSEGWEYTFEYPALDEQPDLDPEQAFLLVLGVPRIGGGERHIFHALVPVHQPKGLWDKVLGALDPSRWARAAAGWLVQGAHGTLCGVVEGITGTEIAECDGEARGLMGDILTGTPPNLTYEHPFIQESVDGGVGRRLRRVGGDPGLDGAELHRPGAPGPAPIGLAGDGAPAGAGPDRRRVVPLVVRPGHRRGPRRLPVHRRVPGGHPRATCSALRWTRC